MAWTAPRTWTDGELVNAAIMNPHVRDNLNAIRSIAIRKPSDESVASSTAMQSDDHFLFSIAASEIWHVEIQLLWTAQAGGGTGLDFAWTIPAGATGYHNSLSTQVGGTDARFVFGTTLATEILLPWNTAADQVSLVRAVVVNGVTPGTVQFQWAQNVSHATAVIVRANSFLIAHRA